MKKKLISFLLTLAVIFSCSLTTMATDLNNTDSSMFWLDQTMEAMKIGESVQLKAYLNGTEAAAAWSSSDASIATVSSDGTIKGAKLGITTITASAAGFNATCIVHVVLKGIDVAKYQKEIDWDSVKASGMDFALIRTGYGGEAWDKQTDPYFNYNYENATRVGLKVGAYHYSYATTVDMASQEADMCLSILNGRKLDYPVFYDIEDDDQRSLNSDQLADIAAAFCNKLKAAGYQVGIYSAPSFYNSLLSSPRLDVYEKWVAHWGVDQPRYNKPFTIWQYDNQSSVPGITGNVDADYSYWDYSSTNTLKSDTIMPYTFGTNNTYTYKITTTLSKAPTAVSSNPAAVSVAFYKKVSDGYLYRITNENAGTAQITTTASDGTSSNFTATGKAKGLISDTVSPFTMKPGAIYQFKFTLVGGATGTPIISSGNSSVLSVVSTVKSGNSFYVKVQAKNNGCTSVYTTLPGQKVVRQCVVNVAGGTTPASPGTGTAATSLTSDTTSPFTMKTGAIYQFKFTLVGGTIGTPIISSGNGSVLNIVSTVKSGNGFYVKVRANGSGCTGIYTTLPGQQAVRQCVITVE